MRWRSVPVAAGEAGGAFGAGSVARIGAGVRGDEAGGGANSAQAAGQCGEAGGGPAIHRALVARPQGQMAHLMHEEEERRPGRLALDRRDPARAVVHSGGKCGDGNAAARARAVGNERDGPEQARQVFVGGARARSRRENAGERYAAEGDSSSRSKRRRRAASGGHTALS